MSFLRFQDMSVRSKLMLIIMAISGTAIILACAAFVTHEIYLFREAAVRRITTIAAVLATNTGAALTFSDSDAAREALSALRAEPAVFFACLYDREGKVLAQHTGRNIPVAIAPPAFRGARSDFEHGYLLVTRPVIVNRETVGYVFIQAELSELADLLFHNLAIFLLIAVMALIMTFSLSLALQRTISTPLLNLSQTARRISSTRDYSIRIVSGRGDEIGSVIDSLNEMMAEIQNRDEELRRANLSLEERVRDRTGQLEREVRERRQAEDRLRHYSEQLEKSNRELQDFAYIASHDLQEPLRKIQAFGDRLKTRCRDQLDESGRDYLDRMDQAAQRMGRLISGLLDFSRVATKAREFSAIDLGVVAQEVLEDLEVRIARSSARITLDKLPTLQADGLQMRQLFQNLIGNALKYARPNVPPVIAVTCTRPPEPAADPHARCEIRVRDNGIGFDPKYGERIFGIFQRLHTREEYEGTGIGLAICRRIVERHHGAIRAESEPGQGATFIVSLPLAHEPEHELAQAPERNPKQETDHV